MANSLMTLHMLMFNIFLVLLYTVPPEIGNVEIISVTQNKMVITWVYNSGSLMNQVAVALKFQYAIEGTDEFHLYPVNGSIDAALEEATIFDDFDEKASYEVKVLVYEGNNIHASVIPGIDPPAYRPGKLYK